MVDHEEEVVDDEFLDSTYCEGLELQSSGEGMEEEEVAEKHSPGIGSRVSKSYRAPI